MGASYSSNLMEQAIHVRPSFPTASTGTEGVRFMGGDTNIKNMTSYDARKFYIGDKMKQKNVSKVARLAQFSFQCILEPVHCALMLFAGIESHRRSSSADPWTSMFKARNISTELVSRVL